MIRLTFLSWVAALVTCLALAPERGSAQLPPLSLIDLQDERGPRVGGELGTYMGGSFDARLVTLGVAAEVPLMPELLLSMDWGFGAIFTGEPISILGTGGDDSAADVANPGVALLYRHDGGDTLATVGAGVSVPLTQSPDGIGDALAELVLRASWGGTRGLWDLWKLSVEATGLSLPFRLESRVSEHAVVGLEGAFAYVFLPDIDDGIIAQIAGTIAYAGDDVIGGLRLQGVYLETFEGSGGDELQTAIEPFVQADLLGGYTYVRFLYNLDDPLAEGDVWGLRVGGGGTF